MTSPRRRTGISDVARAAGVSVGTVSNVLNRPELVSETTRSRVEEAITTLSFVRNGSARHLRQGATRTVGAILLDIANPFFTVLARGVEDRLAADDFTLMLASSDDDSERESKYVRLFEEHGVRGLLVVPTRHSLEHLVQAHSRGLKVVLLDSPSPVEFMPSVSVDDEAGGALAAAHLLALGHETIVFLNGSHRYRQAEARRAGVDRAVLAAGRDPQQTVQEVVLPTLDASGGDRAIEQWIVEHGGAPPSAIFCVNDLVAIGVQRRLRRIGGTDLLRRTAVVGYDDIEVASELAVPLTSIRQPTYEMGTTAATMVLRQDDEQPVSSVVFSPVLVTRDSSVPRG